jgi:hypothetical protein
VIPASRQRNYLQSALYVVIVGVIATFLLDRLLTYAEAAERAAVEATVSRVNNALSARLAYLALRGEYAAIESLPAVSPFDTVQARIPAYLGQFDGMPPEVEGGAWYFDRMRRELVYVPKLSRHLTDAGDEMARPALRYRVEVLSAGARAYRGARLQPVGSWIWDPRP